VRYSHLVGQTLPCPKCKNPVQVVPPSDPLFPAPVPERFEGDRAAPPQAVNSEAITKADPADWDVERLVSQTSPNSVPELPQAEPPVAAESRTHLSEPPSAPHRNPASWQSRNVVARRNILLVSLIAACGFILAGITFFVFVRTFGKPVDRVANNPPIAQGPSVPDQKPVEPAAGTQDLAPQEDANAVDTPLQNKVEDPSNNTLPISEPTGGAPSEKAVELPANLVPPDPLANPPGNNTEPPTTEPGNIAMEENLPSVFEDFQRWIDAPSRGNWDDIGKADRTIENEVAIENTEVLFREEYYPNPIPIPNWEERSQRKLTSVKMKPMPILRCIDWFSKIANIGVTADWLELNLAGVDFSQPISIEGQNRSVGELLDQFCKDQGLELYIDPAGLPHVRPSQERMQGLIGPEGILNTEKTLDAIPLQDRDAWVPLLIRMLDLSQCQYAQGRLEWTENANLYDRARLLAALQALQDSASDPPAKIVLPGNAFDFSRPEAWWALREKVQAPIPLARIIYEERPIIDLLAMACEQSGTQLVIDWPAAWSHGLHPSRLSLSVLRGRTLEEIANRYLDDYALELVPLDSKTVLLTTDAVRRSIEQVVPVRLDRGMATEEIKGAIRSLVPRGLNQKSRFRWELVPNRNQLALLRICLPALTHLRESELQRAFDFQSLNTKIDRE
jgi:hypothetical protein